ncbi:MAG: hypothetical protein IPO98_07625 [Saprospiraceae bacterium]|nr:hypothetical protein [Saprospiraceae bacterium]
MQTVVPQQQPKIQPPIPVGECNTSYRNSNKNIANLPSPIAIIAGDTTVCNGKSTTITAGGGIGYSWITGVTTASITVGAGAYTVTITDANGCTDTAIKNIAILPSPLAIIAGDTTVCNGKTTAITASGGIGYSWNTGVTTASITVGAGAYTVTITDANGCTATAIKNIANLPSPLAIIAGDTTVCNAKTTTITAGGGIGYSWNTGVTTASITVGAGSYTVTITDANGCTATTSKNIANLPSPLAIIAGDTTVCNAKTTTITASGGIGYSWNTGVTTASITVGAGAYTVTITDANGCTDTAIKNIANLPSPIAIIAGDTTVCNAKQQPSQQVVA